jgi:hypothetical protein
MPSGYLVALANSIGEVETRPASPLLAAAYNKPNLP